MAAFECTVSKVDGIYQTSVVQGHQATCVHAEDSAAWDLGLKLLGWNLASIERKALSNADIAAGMTSRWALNSKEQAQ